MRHLRQQSPQVPSRSQRPRRQCLEPTRWNTSDTRYFSCGRNIPCFLNQYNATAVFRDLCVLLAYVRGLCRFNEAEKVGQDISVRDKIARDEIAQRQNRSATKSHSTKQQYVKTVYEWNGADVVSKYYLNNQLGAVYFFSFTSGNEKLVCIKKAFNFLTYNDR